MPPEQKRAKLHRYKARLIRHITTKPSRAFLQMAQKDLLEGETPYLYHIIRNNRRRSTQRILQIVDETGQVHTTPDGIAQAFISTFTNKYNKLRSDDNAIANILAAVDNIAPGIHKHTLERPITDTEIEAAMKRSGSRKAPGLDGLPQEFYSAVWDTAKNEIIRVINCMFRDKTTSQQQKRGVLISISKTANPCTIGDYRQITLLPTDYKLLARVLAQRIKVATSEQLYDTVLRRSGAYCYRRLSIRT
jgi:hypothetical protein